MAEKVLKSSSHGYSIYRYNKLSTVDELFNSINCKLETNNS